MQSWGYPLYDGRSYEASSERAIPEDQRTPDRGLKRASQMGYPGYPLKTD